MTELPLLNMMCTQQEKIMLCHTRKEARELGQPTYYTGIPCPQGHTSVRYTKGGGCKECNTIRQRTRMHAVVPPEKQALYQKKWNGSTKGYLAKTRWKEKDPMNAWACSAVGGAKARAAKYGVPFDLDKDYIRSILPEKCPIFGQKFVWFGQKLSPFSPSLDRIRPEKGYVKGNVAVISQRANAIKSDASTDEIAAVLRWLREKD